MKVEDLKLPFSEDLFLEINNQLIDSSLVASQLSVSPDNSKFITNTKYYGHYDDLDLHILTVEHSGTEDARVGVSLDIFKLMKKYSLQNALVAAYSKSTESWRYSLVASNLSVNDKGKITKEFSNPRRYSFVLGPNQKVLTPYKQLVQAGKVSNITELLKKFSLEVVNNEFYKEIANLYDELVGTDKITRKLTYPNNGDESHEFAVRLVGRIIFCWFLREKKSKSGISLVPMNVLSREASNQSSYYHNTLATLFFEVLNRPIQRRTNKFRVGEYKNIPYLNGGLFNNDSIDHYKFDEGLELSVPGLVDVPDSWLHELFDLLERFNFTVDENTSYDTDLSIDPEMLGRVFENLLARINPETGETVRKSTGSFYTPREVVEYMVDASLSEYLVSKTGVIREKIDALISYDLVDDVMNELNKEERISVLEALSTLTVLDPACGSGAFPIGMLQKIVFIITQLDPNAEWWLAKQLEGASPELRREFTNRSVDYIRKLGVIRQTIFGVDIQPVATEISRLRCFLTLIVEEAVDDSQENRGIRPLPNLDFKFVTANSLMHLPEQRLETGQTQTDMFDHSQQQLIDHLLLFINAYFSAETLERSEIKAEYRRVQNVLWANMHKSSAYGQQSLALTGWDPFVHSSSDWFDPIWMFGIEGGFNIVIGNPPYIQLQKDGGYLADLYKDQGYTTFARSGDIYSLFYERGLQLTNTNEGFLCYITSNKWMRAGYGEKTRAYFASRNPLKLIDFGGFQVFESATVDTNILLIKNGDNFDSLAASRFKNDYSKQQSIKNYFDEHSVRLDDLSSGTWFIGNSAEIELKEKIESIGKPIKDWSVEIFRGVLTGYNEAFIISEAARRRLIAEDPKSADVIKPILRGKDIKRYDIDYKNIYLIATFPVLHLDIDKYPAIKNYLESYGKDRLEQSGTTLSDGAKSRKKTGNKWFETQDQIGYYREFTRDKIIYPVISDKASFYLDSYGYLINDKAFMIAGEHLKYLIAFLNSSLSHKYMKMIGSPLGGEGVEYRKIYIDDYPIPAINDSNQDDAEKLEELVTNLIQTSDSSSKSELQEKIDTMVYKLYNLTPEEIQIIESSTK